MKKQMKTAFRSVFTALLGVVIFACMSLSAFAYEGTAKDKVNVRDAAVTGNVLGSLNPGQKIEITGETTDGNGQVWYQFDFNGATGYVRGDFVTTDGNPGAATSELTDTNVTSVPEMDAKVVNTDQVNVRGGAGTEYPNLGQLKQGTAVKVIGEANDSTGLKWYKVRYNGDSIGYIRNDFMEVDESSAAEATTEDPSAAASEATTAEAPVTEDPAAGTNPGGTMGQQYTVAYSDNGTTTVPYLVDHNSSSQVEVSKLLESYNEVGTLRAQAKQGNIIKIVCIILAIVALVAIVLLCIVGMRFRKYLEGGDPSYDDDGDFDDDYGDEDQYDDDDDYGDEEDDYEYDDAPKKKKGGLFARFKKNRRDDDYDDEDDDEDYDDEDDYDDEPRNAIGHVYSPERKPQASYDDDYNRPAGGNGARGGVVTPNRNATKRPRNFMEDDDDFEYGFLGDEE